MEPKSIDSSMSNDKSIITIRPENSNTSYEIDSPFETSPEKNFRMDDQIQEIFISIKLDSGKRVKSTSLLKRKQIMNQKEVCCIKCETF
jgi:hypothetical protein